MAQAFTRFSTAVKAVADVASDLLQRIALGTPGTKIQYPVPGDADTDQYSEARDVGQLWDGLIIPLLLQKVGNEFDRAHSVWAVIETKGVGVAPVILAGSGVETVTKAGVPSVLSVTLFDAFEYTTAYWVPYAMCYGQMPYIFACETPSKSVCWIRLFTALGAPTDIDSLYIGFVGMGLG